MKSLLKHIPVLLFYFPATLIITPCFAHNNRPKRVYSDTVKVDVHMGKAIRTPWLGFGYNQYPLDRTSSGEPAVNWEKNHWSMTKERMDAIKPALVRIVAYRDWFNPSGIVGNYDWNSKEMKQLYQVLDYYQSHGITVMTGLWHAGLGGKDDPDFYVTSGEHDSFQQLQEDFLTHLIKKDGYRNIKWYTPTNEPKGVGLPFSAWSSAIHNTYEGLAKTGLPKQILLGADSWGDWTHLAAQKNRRDLHGYDQHYYLNYGVPEVTDRKLQDTFKNILNSVRRYDPSNKPVLLTESGFASADDGSADYWFKHNPVTLVNPTTPDYGLYAFDYAVQVAASGLSGSLAWALDGFDGGKDPGMWQLSEQNGGLTLRPWFYSWSLMCRFFPSGGKIYPINSSYGQLHGILYKKITGNYTTGCSLALVNESNVSICVRMNTSGMPKAGYAIYTYTMSNHGDGVSLSLPAVNTSILPSQKKLNVIVPAGGAVVLTSMKGR
jgi:hypothetical protein